MAAFRFSEAARLYSRYAAVVDEVRSAWQTDVLAFFSAVEDELRASISPLPLGVDGAKRGAVYRYWWIGDEAMLGHVGFWMENWVTSMVESRRLVLRGGGDKPSSEQVAALKRLASSDDEFVKYCTLVNKSSFDIFRVELLIDESDPVGSVAPLVARLLVRMHEAAPPTAVRPPAPA